MLIRKSQPLINIYTFLQNKKKQKVQSASQNFTLNTLQKLQYKFIRRNSPYAKRLESLDDYNNTAETTTCITQ